MPRRVSNLRDTSALLNGPTHKISFAATHPGLWQTEDEADESHARRDWGLWLWERTAGTTAGTPCAESLYCTADAIFLEWSAPTQAASAWGNAIPLPPGLPLTHSGKLPLCGASALLRSQLPRLVCRDLGSDRVV